MDAIVALIPKGPTAERPTLRAVAADTLGEFCFSFFCG